ncbi:MAG: magnesium transporter CorA family protein [Methanoregulaceae archaeon]|nr:magnesium transporter CorA family protein [Methanoregulaceae archaeon]
MITIYKSTADGLEIRGEYEPGCWVNVVNPGSQELEDLSRRFGIPSDFLTDPLDLDERARIEREESNTLILLRTPKRDTREADVPFITLPIGIIVTTDLLITITLMEVEVLEEFTKGKVRHFATDKRTHFVLQLFTRSTLLFLRYLKEINRTSGSIERDLHMALKNEQLIKLMNLEKSLVFFTTSLRSNALMLEKFQNSACMKMNPDEKDLYDDLIVEQRQAIEMANIYSSILSDMMDAFASVIANNLNVVMKLLTIVTIILMIPTLIVSTFGMNVPLPFQYDQNAFLIIMGVSVLLSLLGIGIFWRRAYF